MISSSVLLPIGEVMLVTADRVVPGWLAVAGAIMLLAFGGSGWRRASGTTLWGPCCWAMFSAGCLTIYSAWTALPTASLTGIGGSALRFAVAATTFTPLVAVLGAKRPQNRGWQWVVFTLWLVLVWPAVQAAALPVGNRLELFVAWKLFLVGLVGLGLLNYLPTRHWFTACLTAVGQLLLLSDHLGTFQFVQPPWNWTAGVACLSLAATLVMLRRQPTPPVPLEGLEQYQQRWHLFRDSYGAFWGLRLLQRINQTAELRNWPVRLLWTRFVPADEATAPTQITSEHKAEIEQTFQTLLRRFL